MASNPFGALLDAVGDEVWPAVETAALMVPSLRYTLERAERLSASAWNRLYKEAPRPHRPEPDEALELMALAGRPLDHAERMAVVTDERSPAALTRLIEHNRLDDAERAALAANPAARDYNVLSALLSTAALTPLELRPFVAETATSTLLWTLHAVDHLPITEAIDLVAAATSRVRAARGSGWWAPAAVEAIFDLRPECIAEVLRRTTNEL